MVTQFGKLFLRLSLFLIPVHLAFANTEADFVRGISGKAFECTAINVDASGEPPFGVASNSWQAHISGGVSRDAYPFFLIRESKRGGAFEIVFFNNEGRGYFVELPQEASDRGPYFVLQRKGRGEGGAWQRKQIIRFESSENLGLIRVRINGSERVSRLMVFKRTFAWELNYSFKQAGISSETLQIALRIDKKLIEND
jgi:hypothetical protein